MEWVEGGGGDGFVLEDLDVATKARGRLKKTQYRAGLLDGFVAETGVILAPPVAPNRIQLHIIFSCYIFSLWNRWMSRESSSPQGNC